MHKFNIEKQIRKLYGITAIGYFQIAGASWVALLAARNFPFLKSGFWRVYSTLSVCVLRFHRAL